MSIFTLGALPFIKPEDQQYFGKLLEDVDEDQLPPEEMKERKIMKLLLKIKNGTPPQRKTAMRQVTLFFNRPIALKLLICFSY